MSFLSLAHAKVLSKVADKEIPVTFCEECNEPLYVDDTVYKIDGYIYCRECLEKRKQYLTVDDYPEPNWEDEED